jgi:aspartate kinase
LEFYYYESIQIWGASVKDAEGIKNVYDVLQKVGYEDVLLVVSAMGKTTNALEVVIKDYLTSLQHCNPQFKK